MLPRKGRKRARSSSPISSPASKHVTPAVDVKKLAQVLKTPRADPALDLWDRFSVPGGAAASPSGLTNPLLAQLLVSSSPRPGDGTAVGRTIGSERPLRKAISCGSHWPKRRKVERSESDMGDASATESQPNSKSFMVSALLDTVNGEINKSASVQIQQKSPSRRPSQRRSPTTNEPARQPASSRRRPGSSPLAKKSTGVIPGDGVAKPSPGEKSSSDYGDDDFDDETLLELDASILAQGDDATLVASPQESSHRVQLLQKTADQEFAEFDDDDDLFDGAEDLVAEVEANHASQAVNQAQQQKGVPAGAWGGDSGGDDYGDDFGDIDFDAVELAATQASRTLPPNVRTGR